MKLRMLASGLMAVFVFFGSSAAAYADCYSDVVPTIDVGGGVYYGGDDVPFTVDSGGVNCDWVVTLQINGFQATGSGATLSGILESPVVSAQTDTTVTATCEYDESTLCPVAAPLGGDLAVVPAVYKPGAGTTIDAAFTAPASAVVTLLPRAAADADGDDGAADGDDNGLLPGTGGASLWLLVVGAALLVAGVGVVYVVRRRDNAAR